MLCLLVKPLSVHAQLGSVSDTEVRLDVVRQNLMRMWTTT